MRFVFVSLVNKEVYTDSLIYIKQHTLLFNAYSSQQHFTFSKKFLLKISLPLSPPPVLSWGFSQITDLKD